MLALPASLLDTGVGHHSVQRLLDCWGYVTSAVSPWGTRMNDALHSAALTSVLVHCSLPWAQESAWEPVNGFL